MTNSKQAIRASVRDILVASKLDIVNETAVPFRNAKGHFAGSTVEFEVAGHLVSDPFKRNYFKRTRIAPLAAEGVQVSLVRKAKNEDRIVVRLVA